MIYSWLRELQFLPGRQSHLPILYQTPFRIAIPNFDLHEATVVTVQTPTASEQLGAALRSASRACFGNRTGASREARSLRERNVHP